MFLIPILQCYPGLAGYFMWPVQKETRWTMIYANSTRQTIGRLNGKLEEKRSIWESAGADGSHASRFVSEQLDLNHWRRIQLVSEDTGKTWKILFTDELERDVASH